MRDHYSLTGMVIAVALLLLPGNVQAEERLRDIDGAPAGLALHPWLEYSLHDHTHASAQPFASLLPTDTTSVSIAVVVVTVSTVVVMGVNEKKVMFGFGVKF